MDTPIPPKDTSSEMYETPVIVNPATVLSKGKGDRTFLGIALMVAFLGIGVLGGYYFGMMGQGQAVSDAKSTAQVQADQQIADAKKTAAMAALTPAKATTDTTCNADELALSETSSADSGAGTLAYNLLFTNIGKRTCTMYGFPGVSLVDNNGNQVGSPATRAATYTEKKQSVAPGMKVKATVSIENSTNVSAGVCKTGATKIRVYPPNDTGYISTATVIDSWCPIFETSPVLAS